MLPAQGTRVSRAQAGCSWAGQCRIGPVLLPALRPSTAPSGERSREGQLQGMRVLHEQLESWWCSHPGLSCLEVPAEAGPGVGHLGARFLLPLPVSGGVCSRALFVHCNSPSSTWSLGTVLKHFAVRLAGSSEFNSQIYSQGRDIFFNMLEFGNDTLCYKKAWIRGVKSSVQGLA